VLDKSSIRSLPSLSSGSLFEIWQQADNIFYSFLSPLAIVIEQSTETLRLLRIVHFTYFFPPFNKEVLQRDKHIFESNFLKLLYRNDIE